MAMSEFEISFQVNGEERTLHVEPQWTLLRLLREKLGLTGTKDGCSQGDCGACVVVMDRQAINSCLVLAPQADGSQIWTVEGLAKNGELHPVQRIFAEKWAFQCGYCTPGMLMSAYALLLHNSNPSDEEIRTAIEGNLCRCTSYQGVVEAILEASEQMLETVDNKDKAHE